MCRAANPEKLHILIAVLPETRWLGLEHANAQIQATIPGGNTLANYLVTYDFKVGASSQYKEFVDYAETEGLLYVFLGSEQLHRLTNTTLWGVFTSTEEAKKAFDRAKVAAESKIGRKIVLEKRVITLLSGWSIISDTKKSPESKWTKSTKLETCRAHQKNDPFFAY